jgi:hypothetical protein
VWTASGPSWHVVGAGDVAVSVQLGKGGCPEAPRTPGQPRAKTAPERSGCKRAEETVPYPSTNEDPSASGAVAPSSAAMLLRTSIAWTGPGSSSLGPRPPAPPHRAGTEPGALSDLSKQVLVASRRMAAAAPDPEPRFLVQRRRRWRSQSRHAEPYQSEATGE